MLVLFLDESGDHSLSKIDPQYPLFVLGGCIFDYDYYNNYVIQRFAQYKEKALNDSQLIIHTADISRNKNGFEFLKDTATRDKFYKETNILMQELDYKVLACVIKKDEHLMKYGLEAKDPYLLSLDIIIERFIFLLKEHKTNGIVIAESRNDTLDNQLELAYLGLKIQGTHYLHAREIKERINNFSIKPKSDDIAGLQIADLVVSPVGRFILGKRVKQDFKIIKNKFRKNRHGKFEGYGLVVFPK